MKQGTKNQSFFGLEFIATSEETEGKYFLSKAIIPAGDNGPPPHIHSKEDEGFYIEKGELTFIVNHKEICVRAGSFINIQKGEKHTWYNSSAGEAIVIVTFCPAGIEEMFRELDQNITDIHLISRKYGTHFFIE